MTSTVLCADIGTSSLKAAVIDEGGNVLAYSRQRFLSLYTDHAAAEWLPSLAKAVSAIRAATPSPSVDALRIDALCISGNGPTLAGEGGETLLWNRQAAQSASSSLFIPRILAFKERYPAAWESAKTIFSGPEYLIYQLTGARLSILPEARYEAAYWSTDSLREAGVNDGEAAKLPPFVAPGTLAGALSAEAARLLGMREGLPVYCGAPDFVSALVGTNTLEAGKLCDRAGSSEGLNLCTTEPVAAENIRTLPAPVPDLWNASYLIPESGSRFSAFKQKVEREFGRELDYDVLVRMLIESNGSLATLDQGKYLMLQTALQVKEGLAALASAAEKAGTAMPRKMLVTGGQAANDDWNQMKADICGIDIVVPACSDAELLGDAAFAFTGMGVFADLSTAAFRLYRPEKFFQPRA